MPDEPGDDASALRALLAELRTGSAQALEELVKRYSDRVQRAARYHLSLRHVRPDRSDVFDVMQLTWVFFYQRRRCTESFEREEDLIAFLIQIVANKVAEEARRQFRQKRRGRERSLESLSEDEQPKSRFDRPSLQCQADECMTKLLAGAPEHYQQVVRMRAMGYKTHEIAVRINVNVRTVLKILDSFHKKL